ncbi:restriction endonuclease subunit S [Tenacibaculum piscium]|uniref:restriction endonuclease subunit S n=1 Tax=Tenacibaculum piscium TaxID=1458515 RepID=UPI001F472815|nr:restriction endonuclease subunit S [Tenacibaculum piscium]
METITKNNIKKYSTYKNSGVEWLGEIPEHWEVKKVKHYGRIKSGESVVNSLLTEEGLYEVYGGNGKMGFYNKFNVESLHIIIGRVGAYCGNVRLINEKKWISDNALILTLTDNNNCNYLSILLKAGNLNNLNTSSAQPLITGSKVLNFYIPIPPLSEQTKIAKFLDDKTKKIDEAIAIKTQQINLLKERKQILIHKAVTRGLDTNVKLKNSGVEWIGEIPVHWDFTFLKRYCLKVTDGSHHSPQTQFEGKNYISVKDVDEFGNIDSINCKKIDEKDFDDLARNGCRPKKHDILLTKDGTIGRAAIVGNNNDFVALSSLGIITPNLKYFNPKYLRYFLISPLCVNQMYSLIAGSALTRLTIEKINQLYVIIPPLSEQKEISSYIEKSSEKITTAIGLKSEEIEKLKEYKSSLINSVVTGKVRVC